MRRLVRNWTAFAHGCSDTRPTRPPVARVPLRCLREPAAAASPLRTATRSHAIRTASANGCERGPQIPVGAVHHPGVGTAAARSNYPGGLQRRPCAAAAAEADPVPLPPRPPGSNPAQLWSVLRDRPSTMSPGFAKPGDAFRQRATGQRHCAIGRNRSRAQDPAGPGLLFAERRRYGGVAPNRPEQLLQRSRARGSGQVAPRPIGHRHLRVLDVPSTDSR